VKSIGADRALKELGNDIRIARKKRRMSVADFCERIGVTDKTLARLENGDGGVRLETFAMAMLALGELRRLATLIDPATDDTGLLMCIGRLPKRIVSPRPNRRAQPNEQTKQLPYPHDNEGTAF
jgi:transcriptional regulator with XRE-family HTH domain